jgi:hypothetical protein
MKKLISASSDRNNSFNFRPRRYRLENLVFVFFVMFLSIVLTYGCRKQQIEPDENISVDKTDRLLMNSDDDFLKAYGQDANTFNGDVSLTRGYSFTTFFQLVQARIGTARYRHISEALADGYADINVVVANMGYHFMKSALVDGVFDPARPEILVYNKDEHGNFHLVAVEYAIPIELSPNGPPEGFSGQDDVWERNTAFGLWLQHAWIWAFNPDGVFNDTNPMIHVH